MEVSESTITFPQLKKWNTIMAAAHGIQGTVMLLLAFIVDEYENFTFTLTTNNTSFAQRETFELEYGGVLVASFLLMSSLAHFLIAFPLYERYTQNLERKMNPFRWFEYALSSSVMVILIAMLFGVLDVWTLIIVFFANAAMNLFGYSMELQNQNSSEVNWMNYIFGWFIGLAPWIIISAYYFDISSALPDDLDWVPFVYVAMIIAFMSFAVNMGLQYAKVGPWVDYLYGERMYQILSLVAKTFMAWYVFFGVFTAATF